MELVSAGKSFCSKWCWLYICSQLVVSSGLAGPGWPHSRGWWLVLAGGWLFPSSKLLYISEAFQRSEGRNGKGRPPQLTPNHFCHNLFINTNHQEKASPGEKGWKNRFNLWMEGVAKGDDTTGWQGFVAMKPSTTPATTVNSFFSSEFQVCHSVYHREPHWHNT